jgi:S1-C subfamily serine protease
MNKNLLFFSVFSLTCLATYAQVKVYVNPETAKIVVNANEKNAPVKLGNNDGGLAVIAYQKGYVTQGKLGEELMKEDQPEFTFNLQKITKLPAETKTKKIQFTKFIDDEGFISGNSYYSYYYTTLEIEKDPRFAKDMTAKMKDFGYNMVEANAVFKEKGGSPDLAVAGELIGFGKETKGTSGFKLSVIVKWSVYSVSQEKVIFTHTSGGYSDSGNPHAFNEELALVLEDAIVGLMTDEKFQKLTFTNLGTLSDEVGVVKTITMSKIPKKSYNSYGEMVKNSVTAVVTVKGTEGHGSGFLISEDGYLLTNHHVIDGNENIEVIFDNGFTFGAEIIKSDHPRDVALLKIKGTGFKPLAINTNEEEAGLGTEVMAIGTPEDIKLGQTVTKGIVSGKRMLEEQKYIQTDVSINPGNSGGPLINSNGEVVGIIVSKYMGAKTEGLGFAIPVGEALSSLGISFE